MELCFYYDSNTLLITTILSSLSQPEMNNSEGGLWDIKYDTILDTRGLIAKVKVLLIIEPDPKS